LPVNGARSALQAGQSVARRGRRQPRRLTAMLGIAVIQAGPVAVLNDRLVGGQGELARIRPIRP
jgi:hypothetical protein